MALTAEEIKKLKSLPDSPTKRLMMQAAGLDDGPEAAFTGAADMPSPADSAVDTFKSVVPQEPMESTGASDAVGKILSKVQMPKPSESKTGSGSKPMGVAGMVDKPMATILLNPNPNPFSKLEYVEGPSTANNLYGIEGKHGESATATAASNAMSGKAAPGPAGMVAGSMDRKATGGMVGNMLQPHNPQLDYLEGPSTANDKFGLVGKHGESATVGAIDSAMSGKAPPKKDDAVGHYWTDTSELQGPSMAPYKFNLPGAPGESAVGNAGAKAMGAVASPPQAVAEGPIPKTPEGLYDVDRLVAEGKLRPETAAAYKASKMGRPGEVPVGRGNVAPAPVPVKNPLTAPQAAGGSWMDRVNTHYSSANVPNYDEQGNSVTVGPITHIQPDIDWVGSVAPSEGTDLDTLSMQEIEQLKAKHPKLADYYSRYIKQRAAKSTVRELTAPKSPKPATEKIPSADTMHGASKKYTDEHPTYEET